MFFEGCASGNLQYREIIVSTPTTRLLCKIEKIYYKKYRNSFLRLGYLNWGYVWSYEITGDSTERINLVVVRNGAIEKEIIIPCHTSATWMSNFYEPYPDLLHFYHGLDPNTFRARVNKDGKKRKYDIYIEPLTFRELSDSFEVYLNNYYWVTEGPNSELVKKYRYSDSTISLYVGDFYANLGHNLREYILPVISPSENYNKIDSITTPVDSIHAR